MAKHARSNSNGENDGDKPTKRTVKHGPTNSNGENKGNNGGEAAKVTAKHARSNSIDHIYDDPENTLSHPTTQRAKEIDAKPPLSQLKELLSAQKTSHPVRNVLHWFRSKDLRQEDNRGLAAASAKAAEGTGLLLTMYLYSPTDMEWHGTSPARSDFLMQSLGILREQLRAKNIPLTIVETSERGLKTEKVEQFLKEHDVSHVYANFEYEVDELRRDIKVARHLLEGSEDVSLELLHDQTAMEPGVIKTGAGGPMKVFTPYHKAWLAEVARKPELIDLVEPPKANDEKAKEQFKDLFQGELPELPENKQFASEEEKNRIRKLWPAGHEAGIKRLEAFLKNKVSLHLIPSSLTTNKLIPTHRSQTTPKHALSQP